MLRRLPVSVFCSFLKDRRIKPLIGRKLCTKATAEGATPSRLANGGR
jgi:hypothetical protein